MNRRPLVSYDSDEESPERRRSREESRADVHFSEKAEPAEREKEKTKDRRGYRAAEPKKLRRNSDRWTGEESDEEKEGSSSSGDSSSSSRSSDASNSEAPVEPPPPKRPSKEYSMSPSVSSMHGPEASSSSLFLLPSRASHTEVYDTFQRRLPINQSQSSLVSYGAQEEDDEDQFARADEKANQVKKEPKGDRSRSVTVDREPKPPRGGHDDSRSPDEIAVDTALEEGLKELSHSAYQEVSEGSGAGSTTPRSLEGYDSPTGLEGDGDVCIPPSPTDECSPEREERFKQYFQRKSDGMDLNEAIQKRQDFKNPSMYEKLIDVFEVDEIGSNFSLNVFNPRGFTRDCFYEEISRLQKEAMERYNDAAEKKAASAAAASASTGDASKGVVDPKRKSRFEGSKKH